MNFLVNHLCKILRHSPRYKISHRAYLILISRFWQNPPLPNWFLSKGYRFGDIKASAHASHKTHTCISLKQRGYSRNYGLVCNLGKQMAALLNMRTGASDYANTLNG